MSGELQVFRWIRRNQEILQFTWTPGREPIPGFDGFVRVERFENQPKLGPAVLYDRPAESSYTTSVDQFIYPPMDPAEVERALDRLRAEPPPSTFFDPYWTRAQLEGREWYSVHGLANGDGGLREVIVLCSCPPDPPTVSARAALTHVETELGYDFAAVEVYRTHDVGPAVSGIGALRIERRIRA